MMLRIFIIVLIVATLSGCGQYGALYLPTKQALHSPQNQTNKDAKNASMVQKGSA